MPYGATLQGLSAFGCYACFRQPCFRTVSLVPATGARLAGTLYNPHLPDVMINDNTSSHSIFTIY